MQTLPSPSPELVVHQPGHDPPVGPLHPPQQLVPLAPDLQPGLAAEHGAAPHITSHQVYLK